MDKRDDITIKSFEKKIQNSKEILKRLNDVEISLSDAMKFYKDGLRELQEANEMLESAELEFVELSSKN